MTFQGRNEVLHFDSFDYVLFQFVFGGLTAGGLW